MASVQLCAGIRSSHSPMDFGAPCLRGASFSAYFAPGLSSFRSVDASLALCQASNRFLTIKAAANGRISSHQNGRHSRTRLDGSSTKYFDFLVIGSGVAGLRYALDVAKFGSVAIITKSEPQESNTRYAQGGVSAVLDPSDSVENHMRDTIVAGAFLCDEETVEVVCREGPERVKELMAFGASFDHSEDGQLHLAREGGHSHHRIVHTADMTGREIERALLTAVKNNASISIFEHHFALDLLTHEDGNTITCHGLDTLNVRTKEVVRFISAVTLLATGGAGHIYPSTTNPLVATGDGVAMGHRAQAVISNMEFVQFHPTALADDGLPIKPKSRENAFLITEAVRGAGGKLFNMARERFMPLYDARGELAPRDVVARSIDDQLKKNNEKFVYLDISHKPAGEVLGHFPNIARECLKCGLDITKEPIPVVPAAHYMCGGIQTGLSGQTSIEGLYAAGEVTCTGLHGANRLASNSLLEALVFAQRAVNPSNDHFQRVQGSYRAVDEAREWTRPLESTAILEDSQLEEIRKFTAVQRKSLQQIMWNFVGIVRSTERLEIAQRRLEELETSWQDHLFRHGWKPNMVDLEVCEMRNLICVARVVVRSALSRRESRGLHYTTDYPDLVESRRLPTVLIPAYWNSGLVHRLSTGSVSSRAVKTTQEFQPKTPVQA
ncbi:L-aspartate oxidase, chloroplastic [Selaginella moellendorffii]|uniref:L-aspartate oxidase, chloroplastic n=1 Tax=Selaginella moellendorffii TaxID=88036 RepID=UPI000D1D0268|nr:L-aspartate oxidase, chloroplastic [Selaginella moellendorffii]|eukprot:XP_024538882.1 L-aspartate oxidase, chloroplastic [Selaginella moellendorffii]